MAKQKAVSYAYIAGFNVELTFKRMKSIRLKLNPPHGDIKISAPFGTNYSLIHAFVLSHGPWIQQQRERLQSAPQLARNPFCDGAIHYVFGAPFKINVSQSTEKKGVVLDKKNGLLHLHLTNPVQQNIEGEIDRYYRNELREKIPALLEKWQPVVGKSVNEWRIRKMKTRWGSCNISCRRIWLNLELAKKPLQCLEYVLVHELTHLHERYHNKRFYHLMDQFLPNWREIESNLN
ncbi:MAG: M48 family metallopeptidase [Cellvibrionaceae bacterium]|nr:M48 family metallopeptidase [Cellvibrionaceae bacterium]